MRGIRDGAVLLLIALLVALAGCAPVVSDTLAQQALREIAPKPGEPIGSARDASSTTVLDGRLQKALDRLAVSTVAPTNIARAPEYPSVAASLGIDPESLEQSAYEFPDGSQLLLQSVVDSSGRRVLASMSVSAR